MAEKPERNLALELARATEAAALAAARWVGFGKKEAGDQAAVNALRLILNTVRMDGIVVIGEGEKDEAPMLYNGEKVGNGYGAPVDVAVDPIEGTNLLAKGLPNAISVVAIAPKDTLWHPGSAFYMDKLVVGPQVAGKVDLDAPVAETLRIVAKAKGLRIEEVTVVILERERNQDTIDQIRTAGARVRLISDGDVAPAIMAALPNSGVDIVLGIGGTPEGVITACAMHGLGGEIQGRLAPQSDYERGRVLADGMDLTRKLSHNDLAAGDDHFFAATGITQGDFLAGVRYTSSGATTQTLVTRSRSGTYRYIDAHHRLDKLARISAVAY